VFWRTHLLVRRGGYPPRNNPAPIRNTFQSLGLQAAIPAWQEKRQAVTGEIVMVHTLL